MAVSTHKRHSQEIIKCGRDPVYFFNNYCYVQHPIRGRVRFETYPFQNDCIKDFRTNDFCIVNKGRQLGLSTLTAAYAVWMMLFRPNSNILIIATRLQVAKNFIKKCKFILKSLPKWMILGEITETVQTISTSKGSEIQAVPTGSDAGRSEGLSLLIVDEAAHIRDFDEHWKGIYPTLSTGGRAILLSTPKGTGNKFFDLCTMARAGLNEFKYIELPWSVHPERDKAWFEKQKRNMTKKELAQEHECNFGASGDTFLDPDVLELVRSKIKAPIDRYGYDRNIWVWYRPEKDHKYILSADTARGDAKDFSAFQVIDVSAGRVVCEYKGKAPPDRLAEMINEVGLKYNIALCCPENNNVGYATIQKLCDLRYPRIYNNKQRTLDLWSGFLKTDSTLRPSGELGIFTTGGRRNVIFTKMEEMLRNELVEVYSSRLYDELMTFVWLNNHKVAADKNKHDDLVMSLAIGLWLYDTSEYSNYTEERTRCLIDAMTHDSSKIDDIITSAPSGRDNNVFLPTAAGSGKPTAQALTRQWSWLLNK